MTRRLLRRADRFYRSSDAGLPALPWRCGVRGTRGAADLCRHRRRILRADYDADSMRAVVPESQKLRLLLTGRADHRVAGCRVAFSLPRAKRRSIRY